MSDPEARLTGDRDPAAVQVSTLLLALALAAALGVFAVVHFANRERERDLNQWEYRMGVVAASRAAAVKDWMDQQQTLVNGLAGNDAVKLYLADALSAGSDKKGQEQRGAALGYLRNILLVTAQQAGLRADGGVPANVDQALNGDLSITAGPDLAVSAYGKTIPKERPAIRATAPILGVQADPGSPPIGAVEGWRLLDSSLIARLTQPGDAADAETVLIARDEGQPVRQIATQAGVAQSAIRGGGDRDVAIAAAKPGTFGFAVNEKGMEVLTISRPVPGSGWILVRSIPSSDVLGPINERRNMLLGGFVLLIGAIAAVILLVWRHGASVRVAHLAAESAAAADRYEHLSDFLRVVTDGQPTQIAAFTEDHRYTFANRGAASAAGLDAEALEGKTLAEVFGPDRARPLEDLNAKAIAGGVALSQTAPMLTDDKELVLKSDHIPLSGAAAGTAKVLMVIEDVTDLVRERERRERSLRQLVTTLAAVIDGRDPFSANHSRHVADLAMEIAREMRLPENEVETCGLAGVLMNLGKIMVARDTLLRPGELSNEERQSVRLNILKSADLLDPVPFDGPVVPTLRHVLAHWDGSGIPAGLSGENILLTARVVAVANAFVGMISRRSWRDGLSLDKAVALLLDQAGKLYDRRPVAALVNYLDSKGGRAFWSGLSADHTGGH